MTDGVDTWAVLEWEAVPEVSSGKTASFQIWIGVNGVEDISFTYNGALGSPPAGYGLTVGAENFEPPTLSSTRASRSVFSFCVNALIKVSM